MPTDSETKPIPREYTWGDRFADMMAEGDKIVEAYMLSPEVQQYIEANKRLEEQDRKLKIRYNR